MTEPTPTKSIDLRLDDSKTAAEIAALTDGDNKLMIASDTGDIWHVLPSGAKKKIARWTDNAEFKGLTTAWVLGTDTLDLRDSTQDYGIYMEEDEGGNVQFKLDADQIYMQDGNLSGNGVPLSEPGTAGLVGFDTAYSIMAALNEAIKIGGVPVSPAVTPDTETVYGPEQVMGMSPVDVSKWSVSSATMDRVTVDDRDSLRGTATGASVPMIMFQDDTLVVGDLVHIVGFTKCSVATMRPRIRDGASGFDWTGDLSDEWQVIDLWGTVSSDILQLRSAGTYAVGETILYSGMSIRTERTIQNTDKIHSLVKPYNGVIQSEALVTGWPGTATVDGNQTEIIGSAATTDHFREQEFDFTAGLNSFSALLSPGAQGWNKLEIDDGTTQFYAFVNATTGEIGDTSGTSGATATIENDGRVRAKISAVCAADTGALNIYAAPSGTVSSYLGDGTTVDSYVTELHQWPGGIADNPAYVTTTTAAKTSEVSSMALVDNSAAKYAIGALRPFGGTGWEIPKESTPTTQYWYIAPDEVQHLGGGQQVLAMRFGALTNGQTLGNGRLVGGSMRVETGANNFRSGSLSFSDAAGTTVNLEDKSGVITATVSGWVGIEFGTLYFIQ